MKVLGDDALRAIARELVTTVRANVTIDWTLRENVRLRIIHILRISLTRTISRDGIIQFNNSFCSNEPNEQLQSNS